MYEGKRVTVYFDDSNVEAIVVGCNRDIGISLVHAKDKEKYLFCLNGPLSPLYRGKRGTKGKILKAFSIARKMIKNRYVDLTSDGDITEIAHQLNGGGPINSATVERCPFGQ